MRRRFLGDKIAYDDYKLWIGNNLESSRWKTLDPFMYIALEGEIK